MAPSVVGACAPVTSQSPLNDQTNAITSTNSPSANHGDNTAATYAQLDGRTLGPSFYDESANNTTAAAVTAPGVGGVITVSNNAPVGQSNKPPVALPLPALHPPDNALPIDHNPLTQPMDFAPSTLIPPCFRIMCPLPISPPPLMPLSLVV